MEPEHVHVTHNHDTGEVTAHTEKVVSRAGEYVLPDGRRVRMGDIVMLGSVGDPPPPSRTSAPSP